MRPAFEQLAVTSEVSVAFIGFVAIFLIFARREGKFSPRDSLRIQGMFTAGFMGLFMSLVPIVLSNAMPDDASTWRLSSAMFVVAFTAVLAGIGWQQFGRRVPAGIPVWNSLVAWPLALSIPGCLALSALAVGGIDHAFLYLSAIVIALLVAAFNFVALAIEKLL